MCLSANLNTVGQPHPDRCMYLQVGVKLEPFVRDRCIYLEIRMQLNNLFQLDVSICQFELSCCNSFRSIYVSANSSAVG